MRTSQIKDAEAIQLLKIFLDHTVFIHISRKTMYGQLLYRNILDRKTNDYCQDSLLKAVEFLRSCELLIEL